MVWHKTISAKALEKAKNASVKVGDAVVLISNINGRLYAMNAVCSHAKCILGDVDHEKLRVKCFCHDAVFDMENGRMLDPPFVAPNAPLDKLGLDIYEIREQGGYIEVDL